MRKFLSIPVVVALLAMLVALAIYTAWVYAVWTTLVQPATAKAVVTAYSDKCHIIGKREDQVIMGTWFNASNEALSTHILKMYVPEMTQYACEDGVTYWREK